MRGKKVVNLWSTAPNVFQPAFKRTVCSKCWLLLEAKNKDEYAYHSTKSVSLGSTDEAKATGRLVNQIAIVHLWMKLPSPGLDRENPWDVINKCLFSYAKWSSCHGRPINFPRSAQN